MSKNTAKRKTIVEKFRRNDKDVGSPEVQVALLTDRLEILTAHVRANPNDVHTSRGMLQLVSKRKKLLAYLNETDHAKYKSVITALGLRK
jgi:small subunit ribosomal protein S15